MANDYAGCLRVISTSGTNAVNTISTASVLTKPAKLRMVTVVYSGSTTANVTVTLDSGAGSTYDAVFNTIAISAGTQGVYVPATPIPFNADDAIVVSAPALAGGTSAIAIYVDRSVTD